MFMYLRQIQIFEKKTHQGTNTWYGYGFKYMYMYTANFEKTEQVMCLIFAV